MIWSLRKLEQNIKKLQNNVISLLKAKISKSYDILNITYQMIIAVSYFALLIPLIKTQSMNLKNFQKFPEYLWMYWYFMGQMQSFELLSLTILFVKNSQLVKFVKRSLQEAFRLAWHFLSFKYSISLLHFSWVQNSDWLYLS